MDTRKAPARAFEPPRHHPPGNWRRRPSPHRRTEFGALQPTPVPRRRTALIGRSVECEAVQAALLLENAGLVTLSGAGGCGKTRLALDVAAALSEHFRHGVVWTPLAGVADAARAATALRQAAGLPAVAALDPAAQLVAAIGTRRILLVLDNCEGIDGLAGLVQRLLDACPALVVLATSRVPLRLPEETVIPIGPLTGQDAEALFCARARAVAPNALRSPEERAAVSALCRLLDGLPLALELAAARVGAFPPRALCRLLERDLALLGSEGHGHQTGRTLEAAIEWSLSLLAPAERSLLLTLSVFPADFSLASVAALAGEEETRAASLVALLVDANLLVREEERGEPHYRMLAPLRALIRARLRAMGAEPAAMERLSGYVLALAERVAADLTTAEREAALSLLRRDQATAAAVLDWCTRPDAGAADLRRARRLTGALWVWLRQSAPIAGHAWATAALRDLPAHLEDADAARTAFVAGQLALVCGERERAAELLARGASWFRRNGDRRGLALCLAYVAQAAADRATALAAARESLDLAESYGDPRDSAWSAYVLGGLLLSASNGPPEAAQLTGTSMAEAVDLLRASVAGFRRLRDTWLAALPLLTLGRLAARAGERVSAQALIAESAAGLEAAGDPVLAAAARQALAELALAARDWERAAAEANAAGRHAAAVLLLPACRQAAVTLATAHRAAGRGQEAARIEAHMAGLASGDAREDAGWASLFLSHQEQPPAAIASSLRPFPDGLSAREVDVLRLLAAGHSNAAIGEALVLTTGTVGRHTANIYAKIGARNRAEAAAYAQRHGLIAVTA